MRVYSRREFAQKTGLLSICALGIGNLSAEKLRRENYVPGAIQKFHGWFCENYHDFRKSLSKDELSFTNGAFECMDRNGSFSYAYERQLVFSNVSYSHKVTGATVNSSRMAVGSFVNPEFIVPSAKKCLENRGIATDKIADFDKTIGLGWDVDQGHIKVYIFNKSLDKTSDSEVKSMVNLYDDSSREKRFGCGLSSVTFKGKEVIEKKAYVVSRVPSDEVGFSARIKNKVYMLTTDRGVVPQYDLYPSYDIGQYLNPVGNSIVNKYREEISTPVDTIAYKNNDDFTLYYP